MQRHKKPAHDRKYKGFAWPNFLPTRAPLARFLHTFTFRVDPALARSICVPLETVTPGRGAVLVQLNENFHDP